MNTVTLYRKNLYKWQPGSTDNYGDLLYYSELRKWCSDTFDNTDWHSYIMMDGVKQFVFKQAKHATLFRLKWS